MKRLLLALAGYALYRWWTRPPAERIDDGPPIALPPPQNSASQRRKPAQSKATPSRAA
jgi:hypothetical protein